MSTIKKKKIITQFDYLIKIAENKESESKFISNSLEIMESIILYYILHF